MVVWQNTEYMLEGIVDSAQSFRVLYLDFDSFFASAEQQRRPELRGIPVGVCPFISDTSCIVAASREAKQRGIRTGMRVWQARKLAADLVCVRDTPSYYRAIHGEALRVLEDTPCRVYVRGIDEMGLVVPSYLRNAAAVTSLAQGIKRDLKGRLGDVVTASIGVGPNSWLAKLAASYRKPNGMMILHPDQYSAFYSNLRLLDLTGISYRMQQRLYSLGIYTPSDFYRASEPYLRQHLGVHGSRWYLRMRGVEVDERPEQLKKSIGHQTTLAPHPAGSFDELMSVVIKMMLKIGYRLRATERQARSMAVAVSFVGREGWHSIARHLEPFDSQADLVRQVGRLIEPLRSKYEPVRRITVVTSDFVSASQQGWLTEADVRSEALSGALDALRRRFGARAVMTASGMETDTFPDRIGFGAPEKLFLPEA